MAISEIHLGSNNALGKMISFNVIYPEGRSAPFPVWYLLHGLSDDHTGWARRTSIERYVAKLPCIVVMPNGERGFYTDAVDRHWSAFETNIVRDIVGFVDATFRTLPVREGRVVIGLSMGGYGALKLALKNPDVFCAAVSHSGAVRMGHFPLSAEHELGGEFLPVFGANPTGGPNDIFALAHGIDRALLPALRIDCGVDDFLIEDNRELHRYLEEIGIEHQYAEYPGGHTWDYWDEHVQEALDFFEAAWAKFG